MAASDLLKTITTAAAADDRKKAAVELAKVVKAGGMITLGKEKILETIQKGIDDKKQNVAREGASNAIQVLCEELGTPSEPYLLTFLPTLLELFADKAVPVRTASLEAATTLIAKMSPHALQLILPVIFTGLEYSRKWQTKTGSLSLFSTLVKSAPFQMAAAMPELVPIVSECMWDTKDEVKAAAKAAMTDLCVLIANKDIERFLPALVSCIANPEEVPECVHLLGATTFVQAVETPTLAIMVPLLARGLNERQTAIKRKTALIIDNMCKLVDNPDIAAPFLPKLLPGLHKIEDEVADPECRGVVAKAFATLLKVSGSTDGKIPETFTPPKKADENEIIAIVKEMIAAHGKYDEFYNVAVEYLGKVGACLINARNFSYQAWKEAVVPFVSSFFSAEVAEKVAKSFHDKCYENTSVDKDVEDDEEEGEDLCNCEFSLAYGAKILLNQARLRLKRGHRYGLCGPNGAGKSTLMRAIANGQVENFPPKELLRTVYVEHDIDGSLSEIPVIEFVVNDPAFANDNRDHIVKVLESVGFDKAKLESPVAALSGGWKMKLALARAMLMNADIMLLDEPTNHLDVVNVAWLESYLNGLKNVTSIIVSHDSGFLDRVCTDIIHYERFKLKRYKGNLSKFVERVPEARSYYDLSVSQQKFSFPEPGYLEGVKTKERAIIKMRDVSFQYPGTDRMQLKNISFQCSLSSRVAVIGPNGAGKSTMIKLLTGEIEPLEGTVWKHPNLRIAYVAQHAFHHIEKHQDKTPNQYIQWRYQTGEDMEELSKVNRVMTEEELKNMTKIIVVEGVKRTIDALVGRRKLKNSYEYECSFIGMSTVDNMWVSRKQLEEMGLIKMINECDSQEAAKQGLNRPLTQREIEKHLAEVGLEPEFGTHSHIKGLSGGQKVKLVIGAAMWNRPHLLVLDEPTNYLDRDSLGALATAIKSYGGGVVMISHNSQFTEHLCGEVWTINHGTLTASGHNWVQGNGGTKIEEKEAEDMVDAAGNTIKAVVQKKLTGKELRKKKKEKEARRKRGEEVSDDEDD